ncbi:MAG TPA: S46 family peptidase, partial [Methylocystis sp.]|nr:S46 family peptidase [Methylocystis sp.]
MPLALLAMAWIVAPPPAIADEGYWPFFAAPVQAIADKYGIGVTTQWLAKLEHATVRVGTAGTSGAFVSPQGLILTSRGVIPKNARLAVREALSGGFVARSHEKELKLPNVSVDVLLTERDVTSAIVAAQTGTASSAPDEGRDRAIEKLQRKAAPAPNEVAEVVSFHGGAQYVLYVYRRYQDVRLVFATDDSISGFTGPYPSPVIPLALLRAYDRDEPAVTPEHLRMSATGPSEGMPVFISGAPYTRSQRRLPLAELEARRTIELPLLLDANAKIASRLSTWRDRTSTASPATLWLVEHAQAFRDLIEGEQRAFRDPAFIPFVRQEEGQILDALRREHDVAGLAAFEKVAHLERELAGRRVQRLLVPWTGDDEPIMWQGPNADIPWAAYMMGTTQVVAEVLLRDREERRRPAAERSLGFRETDRPALERWLTGPSGESDCAPAVEAAMEEALITANLELLSEHLPPDDPLPRIALGGRAPRQRAAELATATRLGDVEFRKKLYGASDEEFAQMHDPVLDMMRAMEADYRRGGREWDAIHAQLAAAFDLATQAAYRVRGSSLYPDTTGTVRLGYGVVSAIDHAPSGRPTDDVPWYRLPAVTTISNLFDYATRPNSSLKLDPRWTEARSRIDGETAVNFVSSVDGVAGNSGSVTVDAKGEVLGVLFSGVGLGTAFDYVYEGK